MRTGPFGQRRSADSWCRDEVRYLRERTSVLRILGLRHSLRLAHPKKLLAIVQLSDRDGDRREQRLLDRSIEIAAIGRKTQVQIQQRR